MYVNGPTNDETRESDLAPRGRISPRAQPIAYSDPDYLGLGFSLKPPKAVRKAVGKITKPLAVVSKVIPSPIKRVAGAVAKHIPGVSLITGARDISRAIKGPATKPQVLRVKVAPGAPSLPIPTATIEAGSSTAPTEGSTTPTASPTGGVVPPVALERTSVSTAERILRGARKLAGNVDKARAAADSISKAAAAAADAGDEIGARRLAAQARAISEGAASVSSGAAQASGAVTGAAEGAVTGAAAATVSDQAKKFLETTTGKVVAGGAALVGIALLAGGKGGGTQSWR